MKYNLGSSLKVSSITSPSVKMSGVSLATGENRCLICQNLPSSLPTLSRFSLFKKDSSGRHLLWLAQTATSKIIKTPECTGQIPEREIRCSKCSLLGYLMLFYRALLHQMKQILLLESKFSRYRMLNLFKLFLLKNLHHLNVLISRFIFE